MSLRARTQKDIPEGMHADTLPHSLASSIVFSIRLSDHEIRVDLAWLQKPLKHAFA